MGLELINATEADKSYIWDLYVSAMKSYVEKIWGWDNDWQLNDFNNQYFILNTSLILVDGEKAGYVQHSFNKKYIYISMILLELSFQRKGFGADVLEIIQRLQPEKPLRLRCFHLNDRALKFYLSNGFTQIETQEHSVILERCYD